MMMQWGRYWLVDRANVYAPGPWGNVDYPPHAIVVLSPLGLLSFDQAHPVWMGLNIVMAVLAPYFAARFFQPHVPFRVIVLPILLFLCWGGTRTVTQFSLISLMFSMLAMLVAIQRPIAGGVWLGLALMKPQVAIPVFLWSVFTRRWSVALTSVAVVGVLTAVFCLWSGTNPLSIPHAYLQTLASYHTGEALLQGISEFRPLVIQVTGDVLHADGIVGAIAMVLMAGILVVGVQEGAVRARVLYAAPPLVACWSLMTFYHLTYGFVILLPVLMLLALNDTPPSALRRRLLWLLQLGMMFDIPSLSRSVRTRRHAPVRERACAHRSRPSSRALRWTCRAGLARSARNQRRLARSRRRAAEAQRNTDHEDSKNAKTRKQHRLRGPRSRWGGVLSASVALCRRHAGTLCHSLRIFAERMS